MLDFSGLDNTSGAFPSVVATNASGPTLRDGTPITADLVNDIWGAFQAILNAAGTTPSDAVESSSSSDLLDSIRKLSGAPGEIVMYATPSDAIDANILPLKGQIITIASYPALVAATYIGDANNAETRFLAFTKCSDSGGSVRDTAGPYFTLPDCRGMFLRALAGSRTGVDKARDYYTSLYGVDYRNMSGSYVGESPGWHIHNVGSGVNSLFMRNIYTFPSSPGDVGGVTPVNITVYERKTGTTEVVTAIAKKTSPSVDYSTPSDLYDEVRPAHVAFQLGIRY